MKEGVARNHNAHSDIPGHRGMQDCDDRHIKAIMKLDAVLIMTRFNKRNPSNAHGYRV